jgi:outer membrane protein TolC
MAAFLAAGLLGCCAALHADPPSGPSLEEAQVLTVEKAIAWALHFSPELAVIRRQRGIAEANVVIARTYPFNPIWQSFTMAAGGPAEAITNRVFVENTFRLDLELCGQGRIRSAAAAAAVSRTEWEIAAQELAMAVRAVRGFNAFVYRQDKLRLTEATIKLHEQAVERTKLLVKQGKLKPVDSMIANADLVEARAQRGPSQALLVAAWNDLRRTMGVDAPVVNYAGTLEPWAPVVEADALLARAQDMRPDLHALAQAVMEADHRVRLERANRFGNPSIGPAMEYNETRVTFVGAWLVYPLPVLNTRRGDIMLREAERDRLMEDRRRVEIQATLDVRAALARIGEAERSVKYFGTESLPALQGNTESLEKLFTAGEPGVDLLRVVDAHRRLQRARDSYLDALWELSQARADLAAAVGDLGLALGQTACVSPQIEPAAASSGAGSEAASSASPAQLLAPVPRDD